MILRVNHDLEAPIEVSEVSSTKKRRMFKNGFVKSARDGGGGRTVLVGVKLDAPSRELLTWALVKVAQPGDTVIALHVLDTGIVNRAGNSSLLSLVKTVDSVLEVYEGFCNLKQVDLKLKLCRGPSVRKILVREAKSCYADKLILGTARSHRTIWLSTSTAKHCAKKLSKDCSVLAVNNGKIVFQKECSPSTTNRPPGKEEIHRNTLFNVLQRSMTLSKNTKIVSDCDLIPKEEETGTCLDNQNLGQALAAARREKCSVCGSTNNVFSAGSLKTLPEESSNEDSGEGKSSESMAIVSRNSLHYSGSSITVMAKQLPEARPGWPLLQRAGFSDRQAPKTSLRQTSVVQWALKLPSRTNSTSYRKQIRFERNEDKSSRLNPLNREIVPVGTRISSEISPPFPDHCLPDALQDLYEKYSMSCRLFRYQELLSATSNFSPENLVGNGGSSRVYRGRLPDDKHVAVKILKRSENVLREFVTEINIVTTLNHKNIISLSGFCFEDSKLLLVYDFLSRGSLEENLHGNKKDPTVFRWSDRYKVAVGVAKALDHLHNNAEQTVIHRDVKSSNILLSDDFEPKISDFGLAIWASTSSPHITCIDVAGTFGYLAPEYFMYGRVNDKVDVYAFGVVLLELLSGRKPISNVYPKGQESLIMWAKPILDDGKYSRLLDPTLGDEYDLDQMERMVTAAALCIQRSPRARPRIRMVLKLLQGDSEPLKLGKEQLGDSASSSSEEDSEVQNAKFSRSRLRSHLNLALLDVEEDSLSLGSNSIEQCIVPWQEYILNGRCSRSSSSD